MLWLKRERTLIDELRRMSANQRQKVKDRVKAIFRRAEFAAVENDTQPLSEDRRDKTRHGLPE